MDKGRLHHIFVRIREVKTWQLVIIFLALLSMSAFFLRQNNLRMIELRNLVKKADEENAGVDKALRNLQNYVTAHMNTELGDGIALQHSYERAYTAAVEEAAKSTNPNAAIYTQVELECRPVYERTRSFPAYTQCAHEKLSQLAPGQDALASLKTPSPDLYRFSFISPIWSPDLAGFAVLVTIFTSIIIIVRVAAYWILHAILRTHR